MFKKEKNGKTNTNNFKGGYDMVLVLFFCTIIIIVTLLIILVLLSTIRTKINNFKLSNLNVEKTNYQIKISLYFLNKIKWLSVTLDKNRIHKITKKMHLEQIDIKQLEKDFKISDLKELLKVKPKLIYLNLKLKIGLEDIMLTTYAVPLICTALSIILPFICDKKDIKNIKYNIDPIYNKGNLYYLELNSNVEVKILNLLNAIYQIYKHKKDNMVNNNNKSMINLQKNNVKCNV